MEMDWPGLEAAIYGSDYYGFLVWREVRFKLEAQEHGPSLILR